MFIHNKIKYIYGPNLLPQSMIKKLALLFYLINSIICMAQTSSYIPIDTLDIAYRQRLKALYNERAAQNQLLFKSYPEKAMRNALVETGKEINEDFLKRVDKGYFVYSGFYEQQINALFQKIVSANPQYSGLATSHILLSFAQDPNAAAIGNGFVVINLPLFAEVKNEYELAFILCHELAHNLLNHPYEGLVKYARIKTSSDIKRQTREIEKQRYNKAGNALGLYRKIIYGSRKEQRDVEFQADSLGFVLYKNAFSGKESLAIESFKTLDEMDKEKDSLQPEDYERLFSSSRQPFKKEWIAADEISGYKYDKSNQSWQVDSLKTHPDCVDRANRLQVQYGISKEGSITANANFYNDVIIHARHDHVLGLYVLKEYGKSLYEALLLLKGDTQNTYLKQMVYYNLVKIQEAQKSYTMNKYVETVAPAYSYSYNTYLSFLRQLRKSEMSEIINQYSNQL